ncbi:hypothetical protein [Fundidesulfovibrio soli]|uniref:hypothetical protein n=1 Tax=Fundidesulfovibrio soli TaxID=2922716 RepID=UPI001FAFB9C0|nr:hypothetical protein [Fundidesulfovibrio soli]
MRSIQQCIVVLLLAVVVASCSSQEQRNPGIDEIDAFVNNKREFFLFSGELQADLKADINRLEKSAKGGDPQSLKGCKVIVAEMLLYLQCLYIQLLEVTLDNILVEMAAAHVELKQPNNFAKDVAGLDAIKQEMKNEMELLVEKNTVPDGFAELLHKRWNDVDALFKNFTPGVVSRIGKKSDKYLMSPEGETVTAYMNAAAKLYSLSKNANNQFRKVIFQDMREGSNCYDASQMGLLFRANAVSVIMSGQRVANIIFAARHKNLPGMQDSVMATGKDLAATLRYFEQVDTYLRTLQERQNYLGFLSAGRDFLESYAAWKKALMAVLEQEEVRLPAAAN